jgi:enoyl-CoA hydratase/carnithine racemase
LFLPRMIGSRKAMECLLRGGVIDGGQAMQLGIVTQLAEEELLESKTLELAQRMITGSTEILGVATSLPQLSGREADHCMDGERRVFRGGRFTRGPREGASIYLGARKQR